MSPYLHIFFALLTLNSIAEAQGRVRTTEDEFGMSLTRVRETEEELLRLRTERTSKFMEAYKVIEKAVQKTYRVSGVLVLSEEVEAAGQHGLLHGAHFIPPTAGPDTYSDKRRRPVGRHRVLAPRLEQRGGSRR